MSAPPDIGAAAKAFEGYFLGQMLESMRRTVPKSEGSGFAGETYTQMFDQTLADQLAGSGGVGLAEFLERQWGGGDTPATPGAAESPLASGGAPGGLDPVARLEHLARPAHAVAAGAHAAARGLRLPCEGVVSSGYGLRQHPVHGDARFHHGVDVAAPEGTPIHAAAAGRVVFAGEREGYGLTVVVEHPGGTQSLYAHASELLARPGDLVTPDTAIAKVGKSGTATGAHLHLEFRRGGRSLDPIQVLGASHDTQRGGLAP